MEMLHLHNQNAPQYQKYPLNVHIALNYNLFDDITDTNIVFVYIGRRQKTCVSFYFQLQK